MGHNGISECEDLEAHSVDIMFDKFQIGSIAPSDTQHCIHRGGLSVQHV